MEVSSAAAPSFISFIVTLSPPHGKRERRLCVSSRTNESGRPTFRRDGPTSPIQDMANTLLNHAPRDSKDIFQVAVPVNLKFNPQQREQFGDGQKNGLATFGKLNATPFTAILKRPVEAGEPSTLAVVLSKSLPGFNDIGEVEFSVLGVTKKVSLERDESVIIPVDIKNLAWDKMTGARPVFFRPVGWNDWFTVQFPNPYLKTSDLVSGMAPSAQVLPNGQSVINPLGIIGSTDVQEELKKIEDAKAQGFELARAERVHGTFLEPDGSTVLTSNGGVWTRYRIGEPYKVVYLAKDPRDLEVEKQEGVVSGTGPHYIGATAEVIVNTVGNQSLMTFYGVPSPDTGPNGDKLAWGFTHQWVGTWLRPGDAFVTPQGLYHWHLNHLQEPVAAEVLTPPEVPSDQNFHGFPKK